MRREMADSPGRDGRLAGARGVYFFLFCKLLRESKLNCRGRAAVIEGERASNNKFTIIYDDEQLSRAVLY